MKSYWPIFTRGKPFLDGRPHRSTPCIETKRGNTKTKLQTSTILFLFFHLCLRYRETWTLYAHFCRRVGMQRMITRVLYFRGIGQWKWQERIILHSRASPTAQQLLRATLIPRQAALRACSRRWQFVRIIEQSYRADREPIRALLLGNPGCSNYYPGKASRTSD